MAKIPLLVPDASVAGRWYPRGEDFADSARAILLAFDQGHVRFIAPSHIRYEVPSLLSKAIGGGRITREEGERRPPGYPRTSSPGWRDPPRRLEYTYPIAPHA